MAKDIYEEAAKGLYSEVTSGPRATMKHPALGAGYARGFINAAGTEPQRKRAEDRPRVPATDETPERGLTFDALRAASAARTPGFKNAKGEVENSGSDWTLNDWFTAMAGEVGEAGNLLKKVRRRDFSLDEVRDKLASELADVVIYLDLLANKAGINLGEAVMNTFNAKSQQLQLDLFLSPSGPFSVPPLMEAGKAEK